MELLFWLGAQLVTVVLLEGKSRRTRESHFIYDEKYAVQGVKRFPSFPKITTI